jgi:hypothetical protein
MRAKKETGVITIRFSTRAARLRERPCVTRDGAGPS